LSDIPAVRRFGSNRKSAWKGINLKKRISTVLLSVALCSAATAGAQQLFVPPGELVRADARLSLSTFHAGSSGYLAVPAEISEGWHINSNEPLDAYLIPTILEVRAPEGIEIVRILYPEPDLVKLEISETPMSLYHGRVTFGASLRVRDDVPPGSYTITATLRYQGCNNLTCIEPASAMTSVTMRVGTIEETTELMHTEIFSAPPFTDAEGRAVGAADSAGERAGLGGLIEERGLLLTFIFIFIGGLALNLTPCIYPLIPITISYFGGQTGGKASRTLLLAVLYVLGMSLTYSVLGTIAAMTGSLFGAALQNPWVVGFIVAVMVGLASSMFGLWEFRLPSFLTRGTGTAKKGYAGAVFMGLTVGIVAAPCIGPFVLGLLTYVGEMGRPALGFLMFFTLAWGLGAPLLVLGTVSGSISRLPRSGDWMVWVRKVFGFVLVAMAFYFARHIIGGRATAAGYAITALAAGIYLGWLDRTPVSGRGFARLKIVAGLAGIAIAALLLLLPDGPLRTATPLPGIEWERYSDEKLSIAIEARRPVVIDFSADWCIPCHELDRKSFSDTGVIALSKRVTPLKIDLTVPGNLESEVKKRFTIRGVPTIIFIDGSGKEIEELRVTGFVGPDEIARRLERLLAGG
jgi:thiol:disulfide interchange protein DsbD